MKRVIWTIILQSLVAGQNYVGYHFKDNQMEERFDADRNGMVTYQTGISLPLKVILK